MKISPIIRNQRLAFTLVELIIVMVILAILMALTFGGVSYALKSGYERKTLAQMEAIKGALEKFHSDHGAYPRSEDPDEGSKILYAALSGDTNYDGERGDDDLELDWFGNGASGRIAKTYLDKMNANESQQGWVEKDGDSYYIIDAFGNRLQYLADPQSPDMQNAPDHFDLWSFGTDDRADEKEEEHKWLVNW